MYTGNFDKIIEITNNWKKEKNFSSLYGTYRASTFKRLIEGKKYDYQETEKIAYEILQIFDHIFDSGDYPIASCIEVNKILKEFSFILNNDKYSNRLIQSYVSFIAEHYFNIISRLRDESLENRDVRDLLSIIYNLNLTKNPLHDVQWYKPETTVVYDQDHINELKDDGFTIVEVYHIPENQYGLSSFLFAKNASGDQFYLHVDNFESGWVRWGYIQNQTQLAIKYIPQQNNVKSTPAIEIVEIDQYKL